MGPPGMDGSPGDSGPPGGMVSCSYGNSVIAERSEATNLNDGSPILS